MFNQLRDIRKRNELKYKKTVILPQIIEKFHTINSKESLFAKRIQKFLRYNYFKTPINISDMEVSQIPGQFRIRFIIDNNNLNKPKNPKKSELIKPNITNKFVPNTNNIYIPNNKFPGNGYNLTADNFDDEIKKAISASLGGNIGGNIGTIDISEEDQLLNKAIHESLQGINNNSENDENNIEKENNELISIEEQIINQIMEDSLKNEEEQLIDSKFNILLDVRFYGPNPHQPIYIDENIYYLNLLQIDKLKREWNKVNQNTTNGIMFEQNYNYNESLSKDMYKK